MILDRSLPARCRRTSLGDLVVDGPTNGYSGPTGPDAKGSPTLRLSATTSGTCVLDETTTKRLYETIPPDSDLWLEPDDLLVQRSNTIDLVGTAAIYDGPRQSYVYPDLMMRLRFREAATARFVWRYINSPAGRSFFSRMAAGSSGSMPKISGAKLRTMQVPLPPLAEQRRIAEVLDRAEALRTQRRGALAQLDTLTQALFVDLLGDPATNPRGWKRQLFGELVAEFRYGTSNKSQPHGSPALRIPNVVRGTIDFSDLKLVPVELAELERLRLIDGDVLFVRTNGNPDFVGRCAAFDSSAATISGLAGDKFIFASYLIRARLDMTTILPTFLREFMLGTEGRRELRSRCKTSAGQFNINTESLGAILIPVPPLHMQREFADRAAGVERLKSSHRASLAELDALFAVLQHRAFRGEL